MNDLRLVLSSPASDVLELSVGGEVDLATVGVLREATERAVGSRAYRRIVFDLERVTFMDSSGMHVLAETNRRMRMSGGSVEVLCSSPSLTKVFELMGLDRVLTITSRTASAHAMTA